MAKVTHALIQAIFQSFNVLFNKGIESVETFWEKVAMLIPSSGEQENYAWLGDMPSLREWIGERAIKKLIEKSYSIKNKDFEASIEISKNKIEDDAYGVYSPMFQRMGEAAAQWADEMLFELLPKGFEELCYDDKAFFAKDHPVGTGNKTKNVSNMTNKALTLESYIAARSAMMSFKNDEGRPMNIVPDLLVVPPSLEKIARDILKTDFSTDASGKVQSNPYKDTAEILVVPYLAAHEKKWFLLDTRKAIKPFIYQERKAPEFASITDPNSEHVFKQNTFLYGVEARGNVGFSFWQLAYGSTGE